MSRIGKKPIALPSGVKAEQKGSNIEVAGPLGKLQIACKPGIKIKVEDSGIFVESKGGQSRQARELHGTTRALIANMVAGVSKGFEKKMQIFGTGYSVKTQSDKLVLQVGFSHPIQLKIPQAVKVNIEVSATRGNDVPAVFTLSSIDKCALGRFAADVRKVKPPEPYQGKGIRYVDEHVRRKVGKAFTSGAV